MCSFIMVPIFLAIGTDILILMGGGLIVIKNFNGGGVRKMYIWLKHCHSKVS